VKALQKLRGAHRWSSEVEAVLAASDKKIKEQQDSRVAQISKDLLSAVKDELAAGASAKEVRQRLRPRLFVFDFKPQGEGLAAARPQSPKLHLELLRNSVTFILAAATKHDEALLRLTSPGGAVATYGLAAAQLQRLRDAGVRLTVCVDTVAASGGYMMACVADHIVTAPFASIGSIGVIAGIPNFHRLLDKSHVEFQQVTAGKYKQTVNVLTPNTEEGLAKFRQDIDVVHTAFKQHVLQCRPSLDIDTVATGEAWLGTDALRKGLVDSLGTSDDQIHRKVQEGFDAVELAQPKKKKEGLAKLLAGLGGAEAVESVVSRFSECVRGSWDRLCGQSVQPRVEAPHCRDEGH